MKNTKDEIVTKNTSKISELEQYQQYQDLYKAAEDNHRKDTKRIYIFFVCVFFAFVAVIWISLVFDRQQLYQRVKIWKQLIDEKYRLS